MKTRISIYFLVVLSLSGFSQQYERYRSLSDTTLYSKSLGYTKKISLTVPLEYQWDTKAKTFPLIIVFDSQNQRSYNYILRTIDYLTSNEQMPASIIIGVESTHENRYKETQLELSDSSAFGSKNELFILNELIPFAQNNYKAIDFNLLIGHSRYGYFTSFLLTKYYHQLNAVIASSPFMKQQNIDLTDSISRLYAQNIPDKNLYYRFCIGNDYPEDFKELNSKLNSKSRNSDKMNFKGILLPEADHNVTPGLNIGFALYEIFECWSKQQNNYINNANKNINSWHALYDTITNHYGVLLKFSLGTLNGKGWYFFNENEYAHAIQAWEKMLEEYPNFSEAYLYIIYAQQELHQDYTETLKKLKISLATTQFYTEKDLIDIQAEIKELEK